MPERQYFNDAGEFACGKRCVFASPHGLCNADRDTIYPVRWFDNECKPCACPDERVRRLREQLGEEATR